jgi:DNA mismatch endonuclease (patch repair protein)
MTDVFSVKKRSAVMAAIKRRDTRAEIIARKIVRDAGFRYRIDVKALPGRPDVAIARFKKAIFVHGCFWHQHPNCKKASTPKSNQSYWNPKLAANVSRDRRHISRLRRLGWNALRVWECELIRSERGKQRITRFLLGSPTKQTVKQ